MKRLLFAACLATLACGDSSGPAINPVGVWQLQAVNGVAPPYTVSANPIYIIHSDSYSISEDGTWTETMHTTQGYPGGVQSAVTVFAFGTWRMSGRNLIMTFEDGSTQSIPLISTRVSFELNGLTFTYQKIS